MAPISSDHIEELVDSFLTDLGHNKFKGSYSVAEETVLLVKKIVGQSRWHNTQELLDILKQQGRTLSSNAVSGTLVGNLFRRVLKLVREEYWSALKGRQEEGDPQDSLHKMVMSDDTPEADHFKKNVPDLKGRIIETVEELLTELEASAEDIANQALKHIHANEVILTIGKSRTVELFLKQAAKDRKFQVIVAESAPFYHGQEMAMSLAKSKIQTTVVSDSAIFAMMSRVNKVIIGTHAVLANGGLKAISGSHTVALAAMHYSVPLIVCSPMYKLTPQYYTAGGTEAFNMFVSPQEVLRGMDGKILSRISSCNPVFEYVPPDLVTLFISNISGHAPSYIYRLLSELYLPQDYEL